MFLAFAIIKIKNRDARTVDVCTVGILEGIRALISDNQECRMPIINVDHLSIGTHAFNI